MAMIDPEQERSRLSELYSKQTDEELASVAGEGYELTDLARETLRAELVKRGLYSGQLDDVSPPAEDRAEFRDLVTIGAFSSLPEAELAKGLLDAAGIESFLFDDNVGRVYLVNVVGGVKVRVDASNAEEATRILQEKSADEAALNEAEHSDDFPSS